MQKLNAAAAFAIAFVLTVFAVTFWLYEDGSVRSATSSVETTRAGVPVMQNTKPAPLNRLVMRGG